MFAGSVKREEELERKESLWHLFAKSLGGHRTRTRKTITDYKAEYKIAFNAQPMKDLVCLLFCSSLKKELLSSSEMGGGGGGGGVSKVIIFRPGSYELDIGKVGNQKI